MLDFWKKSPRLQSIILRVRPKNKPPQTREIEKNGLLFPTISFPHPQLGRGE